jgi:carboxypeptidase Q
MQGAHKAQVAAILLQSSRPRARHAWRSRLRWRVRLNLVNQTGDPYESRNVIGEIRGRERPDEIVLLGAHLDSWDLGTGAEDNGVNAAMVIDAARGIHELQAKSVPSSASAGF